jgi:hypothetical protein
VPDLLSKVLNELPNRLQKHDEDEEKEQHQVGQPDE